MTQQQVSAGPEGYQPEIVVLYCQHSLREEESMGEALRRMPGFSVRPVIMPCSSKTEIQYLVKILERGGDGVQVVGCPRRLCRFLGGNVKAEKRVEYVRQMLETIGLGAERVGMTRANDLSKDDMVELARLRAEAVRPLGPSPMKQKKAG